MFVFLLNILCWVNFAGVYKIKEGGSVMVKSFRTRLAMLMFCITMLFSGCMVSATSLEDNLSGAANSASDFLGSGSVDSDDMAIGEWISGQRGMSAQNLSNASKTLSPLSNVVGNVIGGIVVLTFLGMFLMTAVDLLYITFPPIRNLLYKVDTGAGGMGGGMGMGGMMGGGRFSRYGGMGSMGMGGMGGMGMDAGQGQSMNIQWISDEAVQCVANLTMGGAQQSGMNPMQAGMMAQQAPTASVSMKSTIAMYFKKRIVFMVFLAICVIVLTSSALLGTGVNLALWITKIINAVSSNIPK